MCKKRFIVIFSILILLGAPSSVFAVDVWSSSYKVTGEWGNILVNDYVVTESIRGNADGFTVNVKHVGNAESGQISVQEYEFKKKDGLWCAYVKLLSKDVFVPIGTHVNKSIVAIFDICKNYSSFITLSERDIKAKKAKMYYDRAMKYYFNDKNYRGTIELLTQAINAYPQYYDAYIGRARAYAKIGNNMKAKNDYRYVIDTGNDDYKIASREIQDVLK